MNTGLLVKQLGDVLSLRVQSLKLISNVVAARGLTTYVGSSAFLVYCAAMVGVHSRRARLGAKRQPRQQEHCSYCSTDSQPDRRSLVCHESTPRAPWTAHVPERDRALHYMGRRAPYMEHPRNVALDEPYTSEVDVAGKKAQSLDVRQASPSIIGSMSYIIYKTTRRATSYSVRYAQRNFGGQRGGDIPSLNVRNMCFYAGV